MTTPSSKALGRPSIFRNKTGGTRVHGVITPRGSVRFEHYRVELAKLVGQDPERISDADVVEYMARGELETRKYLAEKGQT